MIKQYFKQAMQMLRESPLVSSVSIAGTALSIAMVMVVVLMYQIRFANYAPESYRDRMLYVFGTQVAAKDGKSKNNGNMSAEVVKECFYALQTPEAVSAVSSATRPVSVPAKRLYKEYTIKSTDTGFWTVFNFRFLEGKAFSEADFQSGLRAAVVSERLARDIFGTTEVVGEVIVIDFRQYTIRGVVTEVSRAASDAYADVWVPYTSDETLITSSPTYGEGMIGQFRIYMLAKNKKDFDAIETEMERRTEQYNTGKVDYQINFMGNPITRLDIAMGSNGFFVSVDLVSFLTRIGGLLLFLLLVPALNLTGVTQSSVQRRRTELGVRKAFGATNNSLLSQILYENLATTLIGGVIGFILSYLFLFLCKSFLLPGQPMLNAEMLFKPATILLALFFTLLVNILSAIIPAARITRQPVTEALKEAES